MILFFMRYIVKILTIKMIIFINKDHLLMINIFKKSIWAIIFNKIYIILLKTKSYKEFKVYKKIMVKNLKNCYCLKKSFLQIMISYKQE